MDFAVLWCFWGLGWVVCVALLVALVLGFGFAGFDLWVGILLWG